MRRFSLTLLAMFIIAVFVSSCSGGMSIQAAANGKQKCGRGFIR